MQMPNWREEFGLAFSKQAKNENIYTNTYTDTQLMI